MKVRLVQSKHVEEKNTRIVTIFLEIHKLEFTLY